MLRIKSLLSLLCATAFLTLLLGCSAAPAEEEPSFETLDDFQHATIGVLTGSNYDKVTQDLFPEAERVYFTQVADLLISLEQGKIDGFMVDEVVYISALWEGAKVAAIPDTTAVNDTAFAFPKDGSRDALVAEINEFVERSWEDGTIDYLKEKWLAPTEPTEHPNYQDLPGPNGTIDVVVDAGMRPMTYLKNEAYTGYEIELLTMFAEEYGYALEIESMSFDALLPNVTAGKSDMAACDLTVTPERQENVTFSTSHFDARRAMLVADQTEDIDPAAYNNKDAKIGIFTGSSHDARIAKLMPEAERVYFSQMSDMLLAITQGKIDAFVEDAHFVVAVGWENDVIRIVDDCLYEVDVAFAFARNDEGAKLREEMNAFIAQSFEDGTVDQLKEKWLGGSEPTEFLDHRDLTGENGTISIAVSPDNKPLVYLREDRCVGLEVEMVTLFAREYGYALDFVEMPFDAILSSITAGKYSMGVSGINITPEREESVDFSDPYMDAGAAFVVAANKAEESASLGESIAAFFTEAKEGFEKTFLREGRWKLFLEGIGITLLISVCSALGGSLLGFGLYMMTRSQRPLLSRFAKRLGQIHSRIVAGTPIVVILMILFYVIFGSFKNMSGVLIAIIGFSLTFSAFVYSSLTVAVNSVNKGQDEAAQVFGYTRGKAFFKIILPQAMNVFMPAYCSEAVALIKATAIVGYVAVTDLTRVGDIIRSNTYEAFFPLIAVAIIYFLLTWGVSLVLKQVAKRFDPKQRSAEQILKGIDVR